MCVVSMVGDVYRDTFPQRYPNVVPEVGPQSTPIVVNVPITREEFEALKRDVEQMKALLLAAKRYDEEHGEPDCEMDEKVALLKRVAELVGVDLTEVFG